MPLHVVEELRRDLDVGRADANDTCNGFSTETHLTITDVINSDWDVLQI